jgi:small ligand-binding sensory domain FIST
MSIRIGAALSHSHDARSAAIEAAQKAAGALAGERVDVALVFACGTHLAAPETLLEGVHEALRPAALIGCGASGVLGSGEEVESGTAVAVWVAALRDGSVRTFHATAAAGDGEIAGLPALSGASGAIVLPDPYTFDTRALLGAVRAQEGRLPVMGGQASGRTFEGNAALFRDELVLEEGAVGLVFEGVAMAPYVSQGAAPLGPELTITRAEGRVVQELAGRPALVKLREVFDELDERDQRRIRSGLLIGIVIDAGKPEYEQGDFLVRGVVGADSDSGSIALGEEVHEGQVVRLHARDARSADRDLEEGLQARRAALGGDAPAGALCFSCTGRGRAMFDVADHDAALLARVLEDAPTAGFFAAGEIGPVRGECFQHTFSASVALFIS